MKVANLLNSILFFLGIFLLSSPLKVFSATISWDGGASTSNWSDANNWSANQLPTAADDVVISVGTTINLSAGSTVNSLTLGTAAGTSAPTFNFTYDSISGSPLVIDDGNLMVYSNAKITHSVGTSSVVGTVSIKLNTGNAQINGAIDVATKGYASGKGTGEGTNGSSGGGGGGHGGTGGTGNYAGGISYGSITSPTSLGSGGGSYNDTNYAYGGRGGGAVKLDVAGTLAVQGSISANGGNYTNTGFESGGGAGGSIYLIANILSGTGSISVNGGNGRSEGGGGAGGRIALYYVTKTSSGPITTSGGLGSAFGGSGTLYLKPTGQDNGDLIVDNNNQSPDSANGKYGKTPIPLSLVLNTLTLQNYGNLDVGPSTNISYSTLNWSTKGVVTDNGGTFPLFTVNSDLTIPATAYYFANTARTFRHITVAGVLTHSYNYDTQLYKLNLTATGNLTIEATGSIDVTGKGFAGGEGTGKGVHNGAALGSASGAGHGGVGGDSVAFQAGGGVYGSLTEPETIGSGGGQYNADAPAGRGGGSLKLTVTGILNILGSINASATSTTSVSNPGGASGGSVYLIASEISGNGPISSNGSNGEDLGSGGGGGRIALYYSSKPYSGVISAYGGSGVRQPGGAGTVYLKPSSSNPDLIIANNNQEPTNDLGLGKTPIPLSLVLNTLTLQNYGNLDVGPSTNISYSTLNWSTKGVVTDNGGTFPLFTVNSDLTIPATAYYFANTARTFRHITVAGVLTHSNNYDTQLNTLDITAQNVTVLVTGKIDVSSRGYYSSLGPGAGNDSTLSTTGEGGGGHGGTGGNGSTNTGGPVYGSLAEPLTLGSGGGYGYVSSTDYEPGGSGGGVLRLSVSDTLNLQGPLLANGETKSSCNRCGGGAGGSIFLTAATISGNSDISAQGGGGEPSFGGGGGGGRIALYYSDDTHTGEVAVLGGSGFQAGQAGTKVIKALGGELISSPYDTGDPATVLTELNWQESKPSGSTVKFQLRTSPDSDGVPSSWSSWLGPTGADSYYTSSSGGDSINTLHTDAEDDQWVQYKAILSRNYDVESSPSVSQVGLEYVVNTAPSVSLNNSPQQSDTGTITALYTLSDPEESSLDVYMAISIGHSLATELSKGSTLPFTVPTTSGFPSSGTLLVNNEMVGYSGTSATQFLNITRAKFVTKDTAHSSGSPIWYVAQTVSGDHDSVSTGSSKSISWTPRTELLGFENNTSQVKVVANDGNSANQIGYVVSGVIGLDTKSPVNNDLFINSRTDVLTLSSTDTNGLKMKISNLSSLGSDSVNAASGTWLDYQSTLPWNVSDSETVYVQYIDVYGNQTTTVSTTAPTRPSSVLIQDASNPETESWRLFVSWSLGPDPSLGFDYYQIYRSLDNQTYAPLDQINQKTQNFFLNSGLVNSQAYYYKVTIVDDHGNESSYNTVSQVAGSASKSGVGLTPDGSGGGDYTAPVISGLGSTSLTSTSATITWTTDELADSKVGYSTNTGYDLELGTITMTQNHSVTLTGLIPKTKYYFRAISYDPVSNKTVKEDSSLYFFTTLSDSELPVISQVKAAVGENSAGITWATSEAATSRVVYSVGASSVATSSADLVLGHSVSITDLLSATLYRYFVSSSDAEGNQSTSPDYTFTTLSGPEAGDTTAPSITDISVSDTTASSTSVSWKTNEDADGRVEYGETESYERGIAEGNHDFKTEKKVVLLGLSPSTTYHYRITAIDTAGNINTSADSTFTTSSPQVLGDLIELGSTLGANAPSITSEGASVTNITGTQATLSWITSKKSTSQVYYKVNNSLGAPISGGDATQFVTSHSVTLTNLSPATTYQYQVKSSDVNGNYIISPRATFTTVMPTAAAVKVSGVTQNSAQIVWTSPIPTLSIIEYINSQTGQKQIYEDKSLVTNHSVALTDLSSSTIYAFTILIKDESGNLARSTPFSFTTNNDGDGPLITAVNSHSTIMSGQNKVQTVITWSTNEPASSKVDYSLDGSGVNFELSSPQTTDLVSNHIIVLTNLKPATVYRFRVVSTDRTGNVTTSEPYVLLSPAREVSALDLIIKNLEGAFGWARALNGTP